MLFVLKKQKKSVFSAINELGGRYQTEKNDEVDTFLWDNGNSMLTDSRKAEQSFPSR